MNTVSELRVKKMTYIENRPVLHLQKGNSFSSIVRKLKLCVCVVVD